MRNRTETEDLSQRNVDETRTRPPRGRWDQSRFDNRPTAGDAGWAEPPHDIRGAPGTAEPLHDWGLSDWEGSFDEDIATSAARSRMQQAFTGRGPRTYVRSDDRIREDAFDALTYQNVLDASDVDISVKDGEVTLTGVVPTREEKRVAEDLAAQVRGVKEVHNHLRMRRGEQAATAPTDVDRGTGNTRRAR